MAALTHAGYIIGASPATADKVFYDNSTSGLNANNTQNAIDEVSRNSKYTGNNGISLSGSTFSNSGVRSIAEGTTAGTINVNTNGTTSDVAVHGLGSAAYTASTAYEPAGGVASGNYTFHAGGKIYIKTDAEGGNIVLQSPNGVNYEMDAYNDSLRLWSRRSGSVKGLYWNGNESINLNTINSKVDTIESLYSFVLSTKHIVLDSLQTGTVEFALTDFQVPTGYYLEHDHALITAIGNWGISPIYTICNNTGATYISTESPLIVTITMPATGGNVDVRVTCMIPINKTV